MDSARSMRGCMWSSTPLKRRFRFGKMDKPRHVLPKATPAGRRLDRGTCKISRRRSCGRQLNHRSDGLYAASSPERTVNLQVPHDSLPHGAPDFITLGGLQAMSTGTIACTTQPKLFLCRRQRGGRRSGGDWIGLIVQFYNFVGEVDARGRPHHWTVGQAHVQNQGVAVASRVLLDHQQ